MTSDLSHPANRFRKKPVVIEAERFYVMGEDPRARAYEIMEWAKFCEPSATLTLHTDFNGALTLRIPTLEGVMHAEIGDYIIRGIKGEFYPCKPDIFEATYEPV